MTAIHWTPLMVEERLQEAADILRRLPPVRVQGYFSSWPEIKPEFSDLVAQVAAPPHRLWPTASAITRMEQTLSWTVGIDPTDAKIIWLRARRKRWKEICWRVGLSRSSVNEHWIYGLCLIAWKLNGKVFTEPLSRNRVLARVRFPECDAIHTQ